VTDADPAAPAAEAPASGRIRLLWWGIGLALACGLVAFLVRGADQPANPSLLPPGVTTPSPSASPTARAGISGFGETAIKVTLPSGQQLEWCVLVADTDALQQRGLMGVTDPALGGYDGMLFRFTKPVNVPFYMKDTPLPLSIAFVAKDGAFISASDMQPCTDPTSCELFYALAPYLVSLEVPIGRLPALGIGPGATIVDEKKACSS
jgi:uncharacterized protein